jgi:hypothetical protein
MRHIIQLSGPVNGLAALCDDGTVWGYIAENTSWVQLPPVPGQAGTEDIRSASAQRDLIAIERQEREEQARRERFQGQR